MLTYLIKYPEIIEGAVIVTSVDPPVKLSANQSKPIKKIYVENHSSVSEGDILLEFQSTTSLKEIQFLEKTINEIEKDLTADSIQEDYSLSSITLGERQSQLSELNNAISNLSLHLNFNEAQKRINLINQKIAFKREYEVLLTKLLTSVEERTLNEKENFLMQKELFQENVISKAQFITDKIDFLTKQEQIDEFKKAIIQNQMSIHEDSIEIQTLKHGDKLKISELKNNIIGILHNLKSFGKEWYQANTILSPQSGEVNFLKNFYSDEYIFAGDPLFAINTESVKSIAYCYLPIEGYGKVKVNQKARIKLNNYPYEEFGFLEGKIKTVSQFPNEDMYLTVIELNNGTVTNTNRKLNLISETKGTAEIVTRDLRVIDRLFFNLKKLSTEI